jgi:sugar/nucleoside kinase (ribokinase family)
MVDICCIGHITLDKVVNPSGVVHMPGGTSFYFSHAMANLDIRYSLVTAIAGSEKHIVSDLRDAGISVNAMPSTNTVCFENIYGANQDSRTQRVLQKADPFDVSSFLDVDAGIYHLGPLLGDDIPLSLIKYLSAKGIVSLDVQGYLRLVKDENVLATDWSDKTEALPYVDILKANDEELAVLTGCGDIREGAMILADLGVNEVIVTLGSKGSLIYKDGVFYEIPAYTPDEVVDATGCGDTYMAGYLYKRAKNFDCVEAGTFGAAMATLKIESSGPFKGTLADVDRKLAG